MFTPRVQDGDRAIIFIVLHLVDILIAVLDCFFPKWLLARLWSRCHWRWAGCVTMSWRITTSPLPLVMKFVTEVLLQDFANPFLINILIEDGEVKIKLLHDNCFYGCVESVEQEEGVWKIFFGFFSLQTGFIAKSGWRPVDEPWCCLWILWSWQIPWAITLSNTARCQCSCSSELSDRTAPVLGACQQFPFRPQHSDFFMLRDEA